MRKKEWNVKDDYFVIAYRILSTLYEFFKSGERADVATFGPDALGINSGYWLNVMESLYDEGHIKGIEVIASVNRDIGVKIIDIKITQKGILFLQENSAIAKAKGALKTAKEIIPCI